MKFPTQILFYSVLAISMAVLSSAPANANQQQLAASMKEARAEAGRTHDQLEATLVTLNALTKQSKGDLRPAYDAFAAEIPKTQAAADLTRVRVDWMGGDGQNYFTQWQSEVDSIANKSL